jgi:hypothetical protein
MLLESFAMTDQDLSQEDQCIWKCCISSKETEELTKHKVEMLLSTLGK